MVQARTGGDALPVSGAHVILSGPDGTDGFETTTDESGNTGPLALPAPDKAYTLDPNYREPAYSTWNVSVEKEGYLRAFLRGVEVVDTQTSLLTVQLEPLPEGAAPRQAVSIEIPPMGLLLPDTGTAQTGPLQQRTLREVIIPDFITVHLGSPSNASARNVRVRFPDYIKNVASSEIYSTWPSSALTANIHAIVTFALNRVYTEWYRSRGFAFDITNHTGYDQYFREGAQVFASISRIVDEIFSVYAHREGFRNPFFTSFCNGTTVTCNGLSQWGTVRLAEQGMSPLEILRYYYPNDLILTDSDRITGIAESYPGRALRQGSQGEPVLRMQNYLNRIRANYPLIPLIPSPKGVFGPETEEAVRTFQKTFQLDPDGIIGRATWNKISFLYVSVTRLAELNSEGERESIGDTPPSVILSQGSRGDAVQELQFILSAISPFYPAVPPVVQDGIFGSAVKNSVLAFQRAFGLAADGIVGPATWNKLYAVYHGIQENVPLPPQPEDLPAYPGSLLTVGSTGPSVRLMQTYLNAIRTMAPELPLLSVDGIFGKNTQHAVVAFQKRFGLTPDGIIGPATWESIVRQYQLTAVNP